MGARQKDCRILVARDPAILFSRTLFQKQQDDSRRKYVVAVPIGSRHLQAAKVQQQAALAPGDGPRERDRHRLRPDLSCIVVSHPPERSVSS